MKYKIVSDSAADLLAIDQAPFASVPLHIIIGSREFIDDETVDLAQMEEALSAHKGRSSTACPQRLMESRPLFPEPFALKLYCSNCLPTCLTR